MEATHGRVEAWEGARRGDGHGRWRWNENLPPSLFFRDHDEENGEIFGLFLLRFLMVFGGQEERHSGILLPWRFESLI